MVPVNSSVDSAQLVALQRVPTDADSKAAEVASTALVGQEQLYNGSAEASVTVRATPVPRYSAEEIYQWGIHLLFGYGVARNAERGFDYLEEAALAGHPSAMWELAMCYRSGNGIEQNDLEAFRWFKALADAGHSNAMNSVGVYYAKWGHANIAFQWYLEAYRSDPENYHALYNIGECYMYGDGVEENLHKAFKWVWAAAEKGSRSALYTLGYFYENGEVVAQDRDEAVRWYARAAQVGNSAAIEKMIGVFQIRDHALSLRWTRLAAAIGYTGAMVQLGIRYAEGRGVVRDRRCARGWFLEAIEKGDSAAQQQMDKYFRRNDLKAVIVL